jgi:pantothenate kinase
LLPRHEGRDLTTLASLVARARALGTTERRAILGIAGPPGAGKTTLVSLLLDGLGDGAGIDADSPWVAHAPMDGFHLADVQLARLGLLDRKGAPETFDAAGYAAALDRLRRDTDEVVYLPGFERTTEQPIAASIAVPPSVHLVVTEGNYLLLDEGAWPRARSHLAEVWYVDVDDDLRRRRLVDRHVQYGKTRDAAAEWVDRSDEVNARRVRIARAAADLVVTMDSIDATPTAD